jgi:tetratricopeptide (TPR) repeat protein
MSRKRESIYKIFLIFFPIIFLIIIEVGFRLFGVFSPEALFKEVSKGGQKFYQINPYVAKRYFDPNKIILPTLYPEIFQKNKSSNTFRIFCLGGSTTAGFPFDCQVPFPQQLKYLLSQTYPHHQFEVINLGLTAINSFSVLDILADFLDKEPDLIIIYMGHNEFYGAYGNASTISMGQNGYIIRFYLKLQRFHITQFLKRIIYLIKPSRSSLKKNETLMEKIVGERNIYYKSDRYLSTLRNFEDNLNLILDKCLKKEIPVILSNLVSNVKDLPPFDSNEQVQTNRESFENFLKKGDNYLLSKQYHKALEIYNKVFGFDSSSAKIWYRLGHSYLGLKNSDQASIFLYGAKDRDAIRFRATEEFNKLIQNIANRRSVPVVNINELFQQNSPQRIPGNNLFCDHLHPDPQGYYLMALEFYRQIINERLLKETPSNFIPQKTPYFVTELDWNIGLIKAYRLVHRWPFSEKKIDYTKYPPHGNHESAQEAYNYIFKHQNWAEAHYKMGEYYLQNNEFNKARNEYLAVSMYQPDNPNPYMYIAQIYKKQKNWKQSENFYKKALEFKKYDGMINYQLALVQREQNKITEAINNMQIAVNYSKLSDEQRLNAKYYLAVLYVELQQKSRAVEILEDLIKDNSQFKPAHQFLKQLQNSK